MGNQEFLLLFMWLMLGAIFAAFTGNVAYAKGLNGLLWALGGFFFLVIALIAVAGMPDLRLRNEIWRRQDEPEAPEVVDRRGLFSRGEDK